MQLSAALHRGVRITICQQSTELPRDLWNRPLLMVRPSVAGILRSRVLDLQALHGVVRWGARFRLSLWHRVGAATPCHGRGPRLSLQVAWRKRLPNRWLA